MKKLILLGLLIFSCIFSNKLNAASIIQVAAPASINTIVSAAQDGDIIELTTDGGAYTWTSTAIISIEKSIIIRAASGLLTRPKVTWSGTISPTNYFIRYYPTAGSSVETWVIDGIEFDGMLGVGSFMYMRCPSLTSNINVIMNNCIVKNLSLSNGRVFNYVMQTGVTPAVYGDLTVTNSEFNNFGTSIINSGVIGLSPNNTLFSNCLFVRMPSSNTSTSTINLFASGINSFNMDHCTFTGFVPNPELRFSSSLSTSSVKNTVFANSSGTIPNSFGSITLGRDCGIYYIGTSVRDMIYPNSIDALATDPQLDASGYATAPEYLNGGTDGEPIGYYKANSVSVLSLSTQAANAVTSTTATLNGSINSFDESSTFANAYGFCWNTTGSPTISDSKVDKGFINSTGTYIHALSNLTPITTYYVRAYATNGSGVTSYGSQVTFTTTSGLATISTQSASSIKSTTAVLNGTVLTLGDSPVSAYGFYWNTTGTPSASDTKIDLGATSTAGAFLSNLSALSPNTTYYVRSFITNAAGINTGDVISFTTPSGKPTVTTEVAGSITGTSATLNATVSNEGDTPVSSYGFCWNATGNPTIADIKIDKGALSAIGSFTHAFSNLELAKVYYFRAYAINANGISYGTVQAFQTLGVTINVTVPAGTNECWIVGNFVDWNLANAKKLTKNDATHYSIILDEANFTSGVIKSTMLYKFLSGGGDWSYIEKDALGQEMGNRSYNTSDVVAQWAITYNPSNVAIPKTISFNVTVPDNVSTCYLNGNFNNWTIPTDTTLMTRGTPSNGQVTFSKTITVSNINTLKYRFCAGPSLDYNQSNPTADFGYTSASPNNTVYTFQSVYTNITQPTITLNTNSLSGFDYQQGSGPSIEKSFNVSGFDINSTISIAKSANYEISKFGGSSFYPATLINLYSKNGIVADTTIYVRLKAGLSANTYNESLTIGSTGATTKYISMSGTVSTLPLVPEISTSTNSITSLDYQPDNGPSSGLSFIFSGSSLTNNVTLTCPTNFEMSIGNQNNYLNSNEIIQTNGIIDPTTVYIRLKSGLSTGDYIGDLSLTSTGAPTKTIQLSGSVKSSLSKVVNIAAGTLESTLGAEITGITDLVVGGTMDARDFRTIRDLMPSLRNLNLSAAMITAWTGMGGTSTSLTATYQSNQIPNRAFYNKNLNSILLPNVSSINLITMNVQAFYGYNSPNPLTIPDMVKSVGSGLNGCIASFYVNTNHTSFSSLDGILYNKSQTMLYQVPTTKVASFTVPTSVTNIGIGAFWGCTGINDIVLPPYLTYINSNAFYGCTGLTKITIPQSVSTFLSGSFTGCINLREIKVLNPTPITLTSTPFTGITSTCTLKVPVGSLAAYQAANYWKDFTNIIEDGASVSTNNTTNVSTNSATLNATVNNLGDTEVSAYGFCWNTTGNPSITDNVINKGICSATGTYSHDFINLNQTTTYYVKAYATNSARTVYGSEVSFTTFGPPTTPGLITGNTSLCAGSNGVTYTVPSIPNAISYVWTLPTGASGTSTTNSITVNYSNTALSGNITVKGSNSYGDGLTSSLAITVKQLLGSIGNISGTSTLCAGTTGVIYTVPAVDNATSYTWTLPTGASGTSSTNSITVGYNNTALSGNITVKAVNDCGETAVKSLAITVKPLLGSIGTISGTSTLCAGTTGVIYTVPAVDNATSYTWTLPTGASGTSSTNSITVGYNNTALSGNITVKAVNDCGETAVKSLAITVKPLLGSIGTISGTSTLCAGTTGVIYTIPAVSNATSYVWTLPTGASGTSSTNSITVGYNNTALSGNITVKAVNDCGETAVKSLAITVKPLLGSIGTISGTSTLCAGTTGVIYTVPAVSNASSYVWTLPTGASGTSSTNSITVSYNNTALSGNITVKAVNDCGETAVKSLAITVKPLLGSIGTIAGTSTLCAGTTGVIYTVPAVSNATSYVWTLPTGASGTSSTNSITVAYSNTALSGNITVKAVNDCGETAVKSLAITVKPLLGSIGTISGTSTLCAGTTGVIYTVPAVDNASSYVWSLPTGASGTSSTNSITVGYNNTALSGNITVKATNDCGETAVKSLAITVKPLLGAIGSITGESTVCAGDNEKVYSVPEVENAINYIWTLPNGAVNTSHISATNTIEVNFKNSAISGNITVKAINECGETSVSTLPIIVKPHIGEISAIVGDNIAKSVEQNKNISIFFKRPENWASPEVFLYADAGSEMINGFPGKQMKDVGNGWFSYTFDKKYNDLYIELYSSDGWLSASRGVSNITKSTAYEISGLDNNYYLLKEVAIPTELTVFDTISTTTLCAGEKAVVYTIPAVENALTYEWSLPTGATGSSTTNSITVDYSNTAVSGNITVKAKNDCNETALATLAVTVKPLLGTIGEITGENAICAGSKALTYSVPAVENALSYEWTLPTGVTGTSTTKSITVDFSIAAESGNIKVKAINDCGETAFANLAITIKHPTASTTKAKVCSKELPYVWNATNYTATGIYTKTFVNAVGCDSIATLDLTVLLETASTTKAKVCSKELPYVWNDTNYNATGIYTKTFVNAVGCDSIATLDLTVLLESASTTKAKVCSKELPYVWNATNYNATGIYTKTYVNAVGCDSIATLDLTVLSESASTTKAKVCAKELPYVWNATNYNATGIYTKTFVNAVGCDSIATLDLTVLLESASTTKAKVCSKELPYVWNATNYNATGIYTKTFVNAVGCDSIATLDLTVLLESASTTKAKVCAKELPYVWNSANYNATGIYTKTFVNAVGCDSIATLDLTVVQTPATPVITRTDYTLKSNAAEGNQWYNSTGAINGAINQEYIVTANEEYYVIVTTNGCSSDLSNMIRVDNTAVQKVLANGSVKIYPNPVHNELRLEYDGNARFEILNLVGQVLYNGILVKTALVETTSLFPGVYLIRFTQGKTVTTKRFIKK